MPIIELRLRAVGWELDYAHAATLLATFQPVIDAALKRGASTDRGLPLFRTEPCSRSTAPPLGLRVGVRRRRARATDQRGHVAQEP